MCFQEREEEEKERREERARVEKIRREEKRAAEKAKRESDFRQLTGEDILDASITSTPDKDVSMSETPSTIISTPQSSVTSSAKTTQAAADTSSDMGKKKHKDKFLKEMSKVVVKILDPYRKKGVKGHIGNTDDFKHLAKKVRLYCLTNTPNTTLILTFMDLIDNITKVESSVF